MAFDNKCLKVNLGKYKVMINEGITENGLSICKFYTSGICRLVAKANLVLCVKCGKRIHSKCEDGDPTIIMKLHWQ